MDSHEPLAETQFAGPTQPATPGRAPPSGSGAASLNTPVGPGGSSHPNSRGLTPATRGPGSRGAPTARFIAGEMFGTRFRIVELLGRGGMGEVYRAEDLELTESIALKFLALEAAADADWLDRFRQEVRLSRNVAHPNICRVYDIIEQNSQWCLSMEYIAGESLAQNLRRMGRPSPEKALEIARQICAGLAAIHDAGLIHRDLKPANIMLDDRGRVRITDFGLAGVMHAIVGLEVRSGTPAYMSPEQLAGREVTQRSDIYALGLVLYELFTGKRTFDADSFVQWKKAHEESTPATPTLLVPDLDPRVERVILRCLAKDPSQRPTSAMAVLAALPGGDPLAAALAAGETPSAELIASSGESGALSPTLACTIAAVFLLAIAAVGFLNDYTALFRLVTLPKSREVLADRARELVKRLAPTATIYDDSNGFSVNDGYLASLERRNATPQRWSLLHAEQGAIEFWYRSSPHLLIPENVSMGRVMPADPAPIWPGMATVRLLPDGQLHSLQFIVPTGVNAPLKSAPTPNWSDVFEAAGLQESNFVAQNPNDPPGDSAHLVWHEKASTAATPVVSKLASTAAQSPASK